MVMEKKKVSERNLPKGWKGRYYTVLDNRYRPRLTIYVATCQDQIVRGISICSLREFLEGGFKEDEGMKRARRRALKAWNAGHDILPVVRTEAQDAFDSVPPRNLGFKDVLDCFVAFRHKGHFDKELTLLEKRLFKVKR